MTQKVSLRRRCDSLVTRCSSDGAADTRARSYRSFKISLAALWPGIPVTPPRRVSAGGQAKLGPHAVGMRPEAADTRARSYRSFKISLAALWPGIPATPPRRVSAGGQAKPGPHAVGMRPEAADTRARSYRSLKISRAALWPGMPVTPPPGCVPDPHWYSPAIGVR